ncbi:MAG: hypothetical protein AB1705_28135, partial [Verrucomicrobiota bacterium]
DSPLRKRVVRTVNEWTWQPIRIEEDYIRQTRALILLTEIGSSARVLVPRLIEMLKSENWLDRHKATLVLASIGTDGELVVPHLIRCLERPNLSQTELGALVNTLVKHEESTKAILPQIQRLRETANGITRLAIAKVLLKLDSADNPSLQTLVSGLASTNQVERDAALTSLAELGPIAKPALPQMQRIAENPNDPSASFAKHAVSRILTEPKPAPSK